MQSPLLRIVTLASYHPLTYPLCRQVFNVATVLSPDHQVEVCYCVVIVTSILCSDTVHGLMVCGTTVYFTTHARMHAHTHTHTRTHTHIWYSLVSVAYTQYTK